jgi:uncharacterized hydrophobic protein (TIGR00271 family)
MNTNEKLNTNVNGQTSSEEQARQTEEQARQQSVRIGIHENAALTVPYLIMNALAAVVACYGLLENSVAVIIGAMIIALLLGPITGMALALVDGDQRLLRKALFAEAGGAALVLLIGFTVGKVHRELTLGSEIMGRTAPNIMDLVIALAGGAAGAYATISRKLSAGLVGVAIATALVPPLCSCGICLSHGLYRASGGAFLLFFTNLVAIQSVTSLVFWLSGFHRLTHMDKKAVLRRFAPSVVLLVALAVFLVRSFELAVTQERLRSTTERLLRREIGKNGSAYLADLRIDNSGPAPLLTAVVRAPWIILPTSCARLQSEVRRATGQKVTLHIWTVPTRQCDAKGFIEVQSDPGTSSGNGATDPLANGARAGTDPLPLSSP